MGDGKIGSASQVRALQKVQKIEATQPSQKVGKTQEVEKQLVSSLEQEEPHHQVKSSRQQVQTKERSPYRREQSEANSRAIPQKSEETTRSKVDRSRSLFSKSILRKKQKTPDKNTEPKASFSDSELEKEVKLSVFSSYAKGEELEELKQQVGKAPDLDLEDKNFYLELLEAKKNYLKYNPITLDKAYDGKKDIVQGALSVLKTAENPKNPEQVQAAIIFLNERKSSLDMQSTTLKEAAQALGTSVQEMENPTKILGKKLGLVATPFEKKAQAKAIETDVARFLKGEKISLETPMYPEDLFMGALIEKLINLPEGRSGNFALKKAITENIDHKAWFEIKKSFLVPQMHDNFDKKMSKVEATVTPASQVLENKIAMTRLGKESTLNVAHFETYRNEDGSLGGSNSHNILGYTHTKACAMSKVKVDDRQLEVMRHGSIVAYGIHPSVTKGLTDQEARALLEGILFDPEHPLIGDVRTAYRKFCGERGIAPALDQETGIMSREETLKQLIPLLKENHDFCEILRRQASFTGALEAFMVHVLQASPENYAKILAKIKNGEPITHTSIGLVTPGQFGKGKPEFEKALLDEQNQAWQDVTAELASSERYTFAIKDERGNVLNVQKVEMIQMNFGVNVGAVTEIGKIEFVSGNDYADKTYNDPALDKLVGNSPATIENSKAVKGTKILTDQISLLKEIEGMERKRNGFPRNKERAQQIRKQLLAQGYTKEAISAFIKNEGIRSEISKIEFKISIITQLADQLREIDVKGDDKRIDEKSGVDPYKKATRVALLVDLLDDLVAFNCKSGKDRTGAMAAELNFLFWEIQTSGKVPAYNEPMTPLRSFQKMLFYFEAGGFDWQTMLTGFPGYMVDTGVLPMLITADMTKEDKMRLGQMFFGICKWPAHW